MVKQRPPASVTASWPKPNFVNPVTRGPELQIVCTLLALIVILILALRAWVRSRIQKAMGLDDWLILAALLPFLTLYGASMASVDNGWDRHQWDQQPRWFQSSELISWLIQLMYTMTMATTKSSILVSFLRLIPFGPARWATWVTLVIIVLWGVSLSFATLFSCYPVHAYWTDTNEDRCTDESIRLLVISVVNIVTDIVLIIIPTGAFWRLQIPKRQKVILFGLLNIGLLATIASVVRTIFLAKAEVEYDITWNGYVIWIMTLTECSLALICASVPSLRPLAKRFLAMKSRSNPSGSSQPKRNGWDNSERSERSDRNFQRVSEWESRESDEIPLDHSIELSTDKPPKPPPKHDRIVSQLEI